MPAADNIRHVQVQMDLNLNKFIIGVNVLAGAGCAFSAAAVLHLCGTQCINLLQQ